MILIHLVKFLFLIRVIIHSFLFIVFFFPRRMEQNECECPCECPLEVNECTGNLTNAENRYKYMKYFSCIYFALLCSRGNIHNLNLLNLSVWMFSCYDLKKTFLLAFHYCYDFCHGLCHKLCKVTLKAACVLI